jgi:hypothetical protein
MTRKMIKKEMNNKTMKLIKKKNNNILNLGNLNKEVLKIYGQFNEFYDIILNPAEYEIPHLMHIG